MKDNKTMQHDAEIVAVENSQIEEQVGVNQTLDLVSDEALLQIFDETRGKVENDRNQASEFVDAFAEMVINGGDASTSSKEALVNFAKIKAESTDRLIKIAELMTRVKLKQPYGDLVRTRDSGKSGGNTINIYDQSGLNKRSLIDAINKSKRGKNEKT